MVAAVGRGPRHGAAARFHRSGDRGGAATDSAVVIRRPARCSRNGMPRVRPSPSRRCSLGCVATPIPGWVDDMRPTVDARTVALLDASAERVVGRARRDAQRRRAISRSGPSGRPRARRPSGSAVRSSDSTSDDVRDVLRGLRRRRRREHADATTPRACDASVLAARLEGRPRRRRPRASCSVPSRGPCITRRPCGHVGRRSSSFALGVVAVASRRRPRSRI